MAANDMSVDYLRKIGIRVAGAAVTPMAMRAPGALSMSTSAVPPPPAPNGTRNKFAPTPPQQCGCGFPMAPIVRPKRCKWWQPEKGRDVGLMCFNSITNEKEKFIPSNGNEVRWYTCGPTVYDISHIGHARAYLTADIMRRIMKDYFKYDVKYQINITDIDDKIILRSRKNKLMDDFKKEAGSMDDKGIKAKVDDAVRAARAKLEKKKPQLAADASEREKAEYEKLTAEHELKMRQQTELEHKVAAAKGKDAKLAAAKDPLMDMLDTERKHLITDHSIFEAHSRYFENDYFDDMDRLGILRPDVTTRISEYMDGRVQNYIKKLVDSGFCYDRNGSVYFSIGAFREAGYEYRKNVPAAVTSAAEMAEGEGALAVDEAEKKDPNDFAVWKKSKVGEPEWESEWGPGRPGWHIECSVMACDIMGEYLDIHAGGEDLKFPHHDNEMAQSEAYLQRPQWVNYFWHAGHLSIEGLKMSKSLKNFITIKQALEVHKPRQLRLMFLMQAWDRSMNYSDQAIEMAKQEERKFKHLLGSLRFHSRKPHSNKHADDRAKNLEANTTAAEKGIDEALKDNFNTSKAVDLLSKLASECYDSYAALPDAQLAPVQKACNLIEKTLGVFGVTELIPSKDKDAEWTAALDAYAQLRQDVRKLVKDKSFGDLAAATDAATPAAEAAAAAGLQECAKALKSFINDVKSKANDGAPGLLKLCDEVRNETFVALGVRLEDTLESFIWMYEDAEVMRREQQEQKEKAEAIAKAKLMNKRDIKKKEVEKAEATAVSPKEYFQNGAHKGKFKSFDDNGCPTHEAGGEEVSAKKKKDYAKELAKHDKEHEKLLKQAGGDVKSYFDKLQAELAELEKACA